MSTIEIAKLLVNRDQRLSITVLVIQPRDSSSGPAITAYFESLAKKAISRISFVELPQDEAPPMHDLSSIFYSFNEYIKSHCKHVRKVVADLMSQPGSGRLAGFVVDMFCTCMVDVANEFNVPTNVFFTSGAAFLGFNLFMQTISDDQNQDVVELSYSDTEVSVQSFVKPVPTKVFWSILRTKEGLDFAMLAAHEVWILLCWLPIGPAC